MVDRILVPVGRIRDLAAVRFLFGREKPNSFATIPELSAAVYSAGHPGGYSLDDSLRLVDKLRPNPEYQSPLAYAGSADRLHFWTEAKVVLKNHIPTLPRLIPATPKPIPPDDAEIVARLGKNDPTAVVEINDKYSRALFSLAFKILGDRDLTEDVVNEVLLRSWTQRKRYDPARGKLLTWLLTITHHRSVDELRKRGREYKIVTLDEYHNNIEAPPDSTLEHVENREMVASALSRLPDEQRIPIEMAYYGGYTQQEIAEMFNIPLGTIKTRTRLGMQKLRGYLLTSDSQD